MDGRERQSLRWRGRNQKSSTLDTSQKAGIFLLRVLGRYGRLKWGSDFLGLQEGDDVETKAGWGAGGRQESDVNPHSVDSWLPFILGLWLPAPPCPGF